MTEKQAIQHVEQILNAKIDCGDAGPLQIVSARTKDKPYGWVFWANTKEYIETGARRAMAIGLSYVIFDVIRNQVTILGSSDPHEKAISEYEDQYRQIHETRTETADAKPDATPAIESESVMSITFTRDLVLRKLHNTFPDPSIALQASTLLDSYGHESWHREQPRVQLAVLKQCEGQLTRLRQLINLAKTDYRDLLAGAEYPEQFALSPTHKPDHELEAARQRDRQQYEAWLKSEHP